MNPPYTIQLHKKSSFLFQICTQTPKMMLIPILYQRQLHNDSIIAVNFYEAELLIWAFNSALSPDIEQYGFASFYIHFLPMSTQPQALPFGTGPR